MIVVDTSVWIDHFNGVGSQEAELLAGYLRNPAGVLVGDLILLELLRGVPSRREAGLLERVLLALPTAELLSFSIARQAAAHYRTLRAHGVTPRKTADLIIATFCIAHSHDLLHRDRDFTSMARHLALRTVPVPLH